MERIELAASLMCGDYRRLGEQVRELDAAVAAPSAHNRQPWRFLNGVILPPQVGAITAMRIDLVDYQPLTPIYAWKTEAGMT